MKKMNSFNTLYRKSLVQVELPRLDAFIQLIIKDAKKFDGIDTESLEECLKRIKHNEKDTKDCYLYMYYVYQHCVINRNQEETYIRVTI